LTARDGMNADFAGAKICGRNKKSPKNTYPYAVCVNGIEFH